MYWTFLNLENVKIPQMGSQTLHRLLMQPRFFNFGFTKAILACRQFEGKSKNKSVCYFHSFLLKTTFSSSSFFFDPA